MGWPQFMPGSYRRWAVDFDNDQKIDLWNSPADIIGSVASFLSGHGWQRGEPVMLPIAKPSAEIIATFDGGLAPRKPLKDYLAAGVKDHGEGQRRHATRRRRPGRPDLARPRRRQRRILARLRELLRDHALQPLADVRLQRVVAGVRAEGRAHQTGQKRPEHWLSA